MATEIFLPQIGFDMEEGQLNEWAIPDGGKVEAGQLLYLLESDKSVQEIESPVSGTLRIHAQAGQIYKVGHLLATIE